MAKKFAPMKHWRFSKANRIPLYKQLEHAMVRDIRHGHYRVGDLLPSISEMDAELSLGRVTIVNAFRELVKDGYAVACHGRGHFVSESGDKVLVGMVLPIHAYYFLQVYVNLVSGVQAEAERQRHRIVFQSSDEDPDRFTRAIDDLVLNMGCRWIIAVPPMQPRTGEVSMEAIRHLRRRRRKMDGLVIVDREAPADFAQIRQNRTKGELMLLDHACANGARHLAFLDGEVYGKNRKRDLAKAATERKADITFLPAENPEANLAKIRREGYDAVLCGSDIHARRLLNLAGENPGFKVAGYDATPIATAFHPRITTVNPDLMAMGRLAFEMLASKQTATPAVHYVDPILVPGETL